MKELKSISARKICLIVGVCLIVAAAITLVTWSVNVENSEKQAKGYVAAIRELIPQPTDAVPEERRDNTMAVLDVDGADFVGILEIPAYDSVLPVGAEWGRSSRYPCRRDGSVYDGSLQIGATTQRGQYDFYRELSVGDAVVYTDMEGNRFTFEIASMRYEKKLDGDALGGEGAALTLFIKNVYSFEYLVIVCTVGD